MLGAGYWVLGAGCWVMGAERGMKRGRGVKNNVLDISKIIFGPIFISHILGIWRPKNVHFQLINISNFSRGAVNYHGIKNVKLNDFPASRGGSQLI